MPIKSKISLGILAGIAAGLFWGLVFLAPQVLNQYSSLEITFGRFIFFGLFSPLSVRPAYGIFTRLSWRERLTVVGLSAAGLWLYTIFLIGSVQYNGGVLTTLVIGTLPITIALSARDTQHLTLRFLTGLGLIILGLVTLLIKPLFADTLSTSISYLGSFFLIASLAMWTWYGVRNASFLAHRNWISKRDFTSLTGIICLICMLWVGITLIDFSHIIHHENFNLFIVWSAIIGLGSTWLAYWLWNNCSSFCPPHISAPLIVCETIFGVLFTFIYEGRLPTLPEAGSLLLFSAGASLSIVTEVNKAKTKMVD